MTAVPFSITSKPFVASVTVQRTIAPYQQRYPLMTAAQIAMRAAEARGSAAPSYNPKHDPNSPEYEGMAPARRGCQFQEGEDATPIGLTITCPACDSNMRTHQLERTVFQTCCDHCGVSGPRRFTARMAIDGCRQSLRVETSPLTHEPAAT